MNNEERELNALMGKLRKMSKELNQNMQKSRFTTDEIAYLKGIQKISKSIIRLLSIDVADFGDIIWVGSKYKEVLKNIQTINESVPVVLFIFDHSVIEKLLGKLKRKMVIGVAILSWSEAMHKYGSSVGSFCQNLMVK